jgi:hypothetical protein
MAETYDIVTRGRTGVERAHSYTSDDAIEPGRVLRLDGRWWLVSRVEAGRAEVEPARYRIRLSHQDGDELGAVRRYRADAPGIGHAFTTLENGYPVGWQVSRATLAADDQGPLVELVAERDDEAGTPADHELEHALARAPGADERRGLLDRAAAEGLSVELVALDPGQLPDWGDARRYVDSLIIDEIEDDLVEQCGVDTRTDPPETWIDTIRARLLADLDSLRADVEGEHDVIDEWEYLDGRIFGAAGKESEEADPGSGYGWLTRLYDAGALGAAGFHRVRRGELALLDEDA